MSIKMHVVVCLCLYVNNSPDKIFVFFPFVVLRSVVFVIMSVLLIAVCVFVCTLRWATSGFQGCAAERGSRCFAKAVRAPRVCCLWPTFRDATSLSWPLVYALTTSNGLRLLWLTASAPLQCGKLGRCGTSSTLLFSFLLMLSFTLSPLSLLSIFALPLSCILAANPAHYSPAWLAYFLIPAE